MNIDYKKLNQPKYLIPFVVDMLMLGVVLLDLLWMMFDALFGVAYVRDFLAYWLPDFTQFYGEVVHPNFLYFDGFIVLIFIFEFVIRWSIAIYRKEHSRWFIYPLANWYDVLGCVPTSSFRFLRLFRILGLIYRLYTWEILDLRNTFLGKRVARYYNILMEEAADRVTIRVLQEAKNELQRGQPLVDEILAQVIRPKKDIFVEWAATNIQKSLQTNYQTHRAEIQNYILKTVKNAVEQNKEVATLEKVPILGNYLHGTLRQAVCDIVFGVFDRLLNDFSDTSQKVILQTITQAIADILLAHTPATQDNPDNQISLLAQLVNQSIDLIISRVKVQNWKMEPQ